MALDSRERLIKTINHEDPGKVVVDMGSTTVTGIQAHALRLLREKMGLEEKPVKVNEPFQLLGMIEEDTRECLGIDVVGIDPNYTVYGFENKDWKPWTLPSGDPVEVAGGFEVKEGPDREIYMFPCGDRNTKPCAVLMEGGYFFNNITRIRKPYDEATSSAREDFKNDFAVLSEHKLRNVEEKVNYYYNNTGYGMIYSSILTAMGDMGFLQGPAVKEPDGIRDPQEWLLAYYTAPDYVHDCYEMQAEIAIENAKLLKEATGDKMQVMMVSGTDFGTQNGPYISKDMFREFYLKPFQKVNGWIHENTNWKVFFHTCGSIVELLPDLYEAGVDILNPVQCSAEGMDPVMLKQQWGDRFVFWGGGVDTQKTLPFGTPEEVYEEVSQRLGIFAPGGGFVFNTIHNVQGPTDAENLEAMFAAIADYNKKMENK
ncbi:uroporphyrinogen decarboxylase family protein [Christensenella tenuis]|uniref:Methyltransferase n=1 Tax=Christensenella tenuis TaxID=2763033 RepID=A0ABR7EJY8_9FIRM|nr:uroporphyrinogen decarboxylase family protein [Christensenella tenuis]MBC5649314.1 methyltransferase [Christensenella tenuis]